MDAHQENALKAITKGKLTGSARAPPGTGKITAHLQPGLRSYRLG